MNGEGVERSAEYREWMERKYTFVLCLIKVFRNHHWGAEPSFLREHFKELLGPPSEMHITTLEGHTDLVRCLTVVGKKLYSGSYDSTIRVWDTDTHQHITTLQGHTACDVYCLTVIGNKLYSGSSDSTTRVWAL